MVQQPNPKQFRSNASPVLDADWQALKDGVPSDLWRPLIPAARYCVPLGIAPSQLDDACVIQMRTVFLATGVGGLDSKISAMRKVSDQIRCGHLGVAGPAMSYKGRMTPRQDQFDNLPDTLRDDLLEIEKAFGQQHSARISMRNLLLRGLQSCDDAHLTITRLVDLFGTPAIKAILKDHCRFGPLGSPNGSRSKLFEIGVRILRHFGDTNGTKRLDQLRITGKKALGRPKNEVPDGMLGDLDQFLAPEAIDALTDTTRKDIEAYIARGGKRRRTHAQNGLAIHSLLSLSLTREDVMSLGFDGPRSSRAAINRPELQVDGIRERRSVEGDISAALVSLLDGYVERCRRDGLPFTPLLSLSVGDLRDDTTFSVAVSKLGTRIGLKLTPKLLFTLTVALLIKFGRENPKKLRLNDIKDLLGIAQFGNFMTRFGRLVDDGVFDRIARSIGLQH